MSKSTWAEVSTICWDWKEQIDLKELANKLGLINGRAMVTELDTKADFFQIVVHPIDWLLNMEEWNLALNAFRFEPPVEIADSATFEDVEKIVAKIKEDSEKEEETRLAAKTEEKSELQKFEEWIRGTAFATVSGPLPVADVAIAYAYYRAGLEEDGGVDEQIWLPGEHNYTTDKRRKK